jgi:serine/threonine protein kinase
VLGDDLYDELAGAIADGEPIDWAAAESSGPIHDGGLVDGLKLIESVAVLHRGLASSSGSAGALPAIDGERRWGHLRVLDRIGGGAFGEVYRAWDERLDREVALKLLPARAGEGEPGANPIIEEGRAMARVRHPNVVTLYGAEVIDGRVGLWMELVRGRTLDQMAAGGKRWSGEEAITLGLVLCGAVAAVHAAGLLHRDIKPANVMIADDGRVVLMD